MIQAEVERADLMALATDLPTCRALRSLNDTMTSRQVIRRLLDEGWYEVRQSGGHKQFKHDKKRGLVTVPAHGGRDIPPGTLASVFRQAGWRQLQ